jgi:hypothetical protein
VKECGCDVWILRLRADDVFSYAVQWLRGRNKVPTGSDTKPLETWLTYYDQLGFETISTGVGIFNKRAAGKNWLRVDSMEMQDGQAFCSPQIQNVFAAETLLQSLPEPGALLGVKLRPTEQPELRQTLSLESGSWQIQDTYLVQRGGFAFPCRVDRMSSELLSSCDGTRTLRSVIESLAQRFSLDTHRLCEEALPITGRLMRSGYLVPA